MRLFGVCGAQNRDGRSMVEEVLMNSPSREGKSGVAC